MPEHRVSEFSDFCWNQLQSFFSKNKKKKPPVYLFLSPESKGSLKGRSEEESAFVHHQQECGGAATLKEPPAVWVSAWDQLPEECAHLFAMVHKPESKYETRTETQELSNILLHESFGRFVHCLFFGLPKRKTRKSLKELKDFPDLWNIGHQNGYRMGEDLAESFFASRIGQKQIQGFFDTDWAGPDNQKSLKFLNKLL